VAGQLLEVQRCLRQRVWEAANVRLSAVVLDTDTTVHTLFGNQMGARKGYNPKNKGKKSFQPILTFLAETKEYNTLPGSCATATAQRANRSRRICKWYLPPCRRW
jgi:hypothetical protein